jgi:hypothetical protein
MDCLVHEDLKEEKSENRPTQNCYHAALVGQVLQNNPS